MVGWWVVVLTPVCGRAASTTPSRGTSAGSPSSTTTTGSSRPTRYRALHCRSPALCCAGVLLRRVPGGQRGQVHPEGQGRVLHQCAALTDSLAGKLLSTVSATLLCAEQLLLRTPYDPAQPDKAGIVRLLGRGVYQAGTRNTNWRAVDWLERCRLVGSYVR